MGEVPKLISDLALILTVAGVTTLLFKKLKQPLVLGYIMAGFLAGPHMPYTPSVQDMGDIKTWSDLGVIFLLFGLGLEFSFKKIVRMGSAPVLAACSIIFCMMSLGYLVGFAFGWSNMNSLFLGGMLAMSSTTIIYKAYDDMGLRQQRFTGLVLSVLILEDILAILLLVVLSAVAVSTNFQGAELLQSVLKLGFFLILWFVVGIYLIPLFLKRARSQMSNETLLIVALGLCFALVVGASYAGFSSAFGAFMMGSILAETIDAERILRVLSPVRDLFGAIFFVSVGMLVDPAVLVEYWLPVVMITLTILIGQAVFGSASYLFSGQPLKVAMQCGFSMAQIGEFAFIIASLGDSLKVTSSYLYPIVVAVSVITTFLTPYMIRLSVPAYNWTVKHLPHKLVKLLDRYTAGSEHAVVSHSSCWHRLVSILLRIFCVYGTLIVAVILVVDNLVWPVLEKIVPENNISDYLSCALILLLISPFLRAILMKKHHCQEFQQLWNASPLNRLPLIFTILVRFVLVLYVICYVISLYIAPGLGIALAVAALIIAAMIFSRKLKNQSISMERTFFENLRSREILQEHQGLKQPQYANSLLARDLHISEVILPQDSRWVGHTLEELSLGRKYGVHVTSILRGSRRFNIPQGKDRLFPGDKLQVLGTDEQLQVFVREMESELFAPDLDFESREMKLRQLSITEDSPFCGKTIRESGIRTVYHCMVVGLEKGEEALRVPDELDVPLRAGDVVWIVGEDKDTKSVCS